MREKSVAPIIGEEEPEALVYHDTEREPRGLFDIFGDDEPPVQPSWTLPAPGTSERTHRTSEPISVEWHDGQEEQGVLIR